MKVESEIPDVLVFSTYWYKALEEEKNGNARPAESISSGEDKRANEYYDQETEVRKAKCEELIAKFRKIHSREGICRIALQHFGGGFTTNIQGFEENMLYFNGIEMETDGYGDNKGWYLGLYMYGTLIARLNPFMIVNLTPKYTPP